MEKLMTNIVPSEVMIPVCDQNINRMNCRKVKPTTSNCMTRFTSNRICGSYIRHTKTPTVSASRSTRNTMRIRKGIDLSTLDFERKNFAGSVVKEIKLLHESGQRLVAFSNREQMKTVNSNVTIYNNRHKKETGLKVKCRYDYNNLLILFYLCPFPQVSLEESQCDPEEPQCAPP